MAFVWYKSNDSTLADTSYTLTTTAGTPSSVIELHAWLNKGSSVGTPETRFLRLYVEDPLSAGTYKTSGLDTLDRREFEVRIIGSQNIEGEPLFVCPTTSWMPIGTNRGFQFPAMYPNCAIEIEVRVNPTSEGGSSSPATFYIRAIQGTTTGTVYIPEDVVVDGTLDFDGNTLTGVVLADASGQLGGTLDANNQRITNVPLFYTGTDANDAASVGGVRGTSVKFPVRLMADAEITWADVVTNGDFASVLTPWTGTNWAQSVGTALHTAGSAVALTQDVTIVSGVRYKITATVTGAAGTVTPSIGAVSGTPIAAGAGTVTQVIVAGAAGTLPLAFTPTSAFDGALDDITCTATLFGLPTIDGVSPIATDRVILPLQTDPAENGKWIVSNTGPWTRHPDCANHYYLFAGALCWVREGTAAAGSLWVQSAVISNIETSPQAWHKVYQIP